MNESLKMNKLNVSEFRDLNTDLSFSLVSSNSRTFFQALPSHLTSEKKGKPSKFNQVKNQSYLVVVGLEKALCEKLCKRNIWEKAKINQFEFLKSVRILKASFVYLRFLKIINKPMNPF